MQRRSGLAAKALDLLEVGARYEATLEQVGIERRSGISCDARVIARPNTLDLRTVQPRTMGFAHYQTRSKQWPWMQSFDRSMPCGIARRRLSQSCDRRMSWLCGGHQQVDEDGMSSGFGEVADDWRSADAFFDEPSCECACSVDGDV